MSATRLASIFFLLVVSSATALGDEVNAAAAPAVTVSVSAEGVRFTSPGGVKQMRLEVFAEGGDSLYNSGFRPGAVRDWPLRDQQGQTPADGTYLYVVTVRDWSGKLSVKQGTVLVRGGRASVQPGEVVQAETAVTVTNDGGSNTSGSTSGSTSHAPSTAGTGTLNRLAKWLETGGAGTLGDSAVFESGGLVGVGTTAPEGTLHIQSAGTTVFKSVSSGTATTGRSIFQMYRGTAAAANGWDFGYNADLGSENYIIRELTNGAPSTRLTIAKNTGHVGVGVGVPAERLHVAGNGLFTGALTVGGTLNATLPSGSPAYVQNTTTPQPNSNFNVSGNGVVGGNLIAVGAVGVGVSAPTEKLQVAGTIQSTTGGFKFPDGTVQLTAAAEPAAFSSPINRVVRGVITFSGQNFEVSQTLTTSINPDKSIVILSDAVLSSRQSGSFLEGRNGVALISLTANSITLAVDQAQGTNFLVPLRASYQIIEYK